MTVRNVEHMQEDFSKHLRMGTAGMNKTKNQNRNLREEYGKKYKAGTRVKKGDATARLINNNSQTDQFGH